MNKLKSSLAAKAFAVLLFILSIFFLTLSTIGILVMEDAGIYGESKEEFTKEAYEKICEDYSITAMADYQGEFHKEMLSETNFLYGVVKTDDISKVDLNKRRTYVTDNFSEPMLYTMDTDKLCIFEYDINKDGSQYFAFGSNLWDDFSVTDTSEGFRLKEHPVDGYYYDRDNEMLYIKSGRLLFWTGVDYVEAADGSMYPLDNQCIQYTGAYSWNGYYKKAVTSSERIAMKEIQIVSESELKDLGQIVDHYAGIEDHKVLVEEEYHPETEKYYVVCTVKDPLEGIGTFQDSDMFVQMFLLIRFCYQVRFAAIGVLLISLTLLISSFLFLMSAAGHHKGQVGICPVFMDKAPLDLYFAGVCAAECVLLYLYMSVEEIITGWRSWQEILDHVSFWILTAGAGIFGILLAIAYCMSFSVNIKLGKWWRKTAVYWILKKSILCIRRCLHFCIHLISAVGRSITLFWKICLVLGGLAFVEFILIVSSQYTEQLVFFWLLEKIVVYSCILFLLLQMLTLQEGAQRIAGGELDYQIDTKRMLWDLKKHGQCLNEIRVGMNAAVNERLKSERFRTELITNVSHDIKTPLTSIINYVDLLQKEQIENPAAREYLEVLSRQSARLKKLIEDLIEASKASSGSLNVIMEQCDAGVMLVQTVGEFEEKLMAEQIMLQIKKPEESIFIEADSRHLWRVFDNMMNNICKYAQPMTRAYVNLESDGQWAVITFRNISKYQLNISSEELMERFVRGDSSRNTEGNGLGISIAKSLTELMNGSFTLVVDGDLFKVVLAFPLYGRQQEKHAAMPFDTIEKNESKTGFFSADVSCSKKMQTGPSAADGRRAVKAVKTNITAGIRQAGVQAKNIGRGAAGRTGRMIRFVNRFVQNVKWAAGQAKMESREDGITAGEVQVTVQETAAETQIARLQQETAEAQDAEGNRSAQGFAHHSEP